MPIPLGNFDKVRLAILFLTGSEVADEGASVYDHMFLDEVAKAIVKQAHKKVAKAKS
jgi:hypothetical protein